MARTTKIYTLAHVPAGLEKAWLQHLRDFDTSHPGCHFEIVAADETNRKVSEILELLRVQPGFDILGYMKKPNA